MDVCSFFEGIRNSLVQTVRGAVVSRGHARGNQSTARCRSGMIGATVSVVSPPPSLPPHSPWPEEQCTITSSELVEIHDNEKKRAIKKAMTDRLYMAKPTPPRLWWPLSTSPSRSLGLSYPRTFYAPSKTTTTLKIIFRTRAHRHRVRSSVFLVLLSPETIVMSGKIDQTTASPVPRVPERPVLLPKGTPPQGWYCSPRGTRWS